MSNVIDVPRSEAQIAVRGVPAWQNFINPILPGDSLQTIAEKSGLAWTAISKPLQFTDDQDVIHTVKNQNVIFRSDSSRFLGTCSPNRRKDVQPIELLEFFADFLSDNGLSIESAGAAKGGRIIWCLAKLGPDYGFLMPGADAVQTYVRIQTSFDGTRSTSLTGTTLRLTCSNMLDLCDRRTRRQSYRTPHSKEFDAVALQYAFGLLGEQHKVTAAVWNELVRRKVSEDESTSFFCKLLDIDRAKLNETRGKDNKGGVSSRKRNMLAALADSYNNGPGAELASSKGTAFGLLNAVTHWIDHKSTVHDTYQDGGRSRLNSTWYGDGQKTKAEALVELANMAEVAELIPQLQVA